MRAAIAELTENKTVITIAHKLQTICGADKIIVLAEGRIIDEGRHEDLLSRCETYQRLWAASLEWSLTGERGTAI